MDGRNWGEIRSPTNTFTKGDWDFGSWHVPVNSCIESLRVKRSLAEHPKHKIETSNVVLCRHCFLTNMMVLDDGVGNEAADNLMQPGKKMKNAAGAKDTTRSSDGDGFCRVGFTSVTANNP